ncbi:hypothetical protein PHLCEN_2v7602, partial [Hermanssonia centrifuga]
LFYEGQFCRALNIVYISKQCKQELKRIVQIGPLDELPAGMNLPAFRSRRAPMPPVMLYGWMINQDDWFEYAKEHGYSVTTEIITFEGEDDPDFELQDFDEDNLPAEVITTTEDKYSSVCNAFWAIMHDLGIEPIDLDPVKLTLGCEKHERLVVLTDNYHDQSSLTEENLRELQKKMGRNDAPTWHPWTYFQWNRDIAGGRP